jgi:uncharacterized protein YfdQ (DUF2303 family)
MFEELIAAIQSGVRPQLMLDMNGVQWWSLPSNDGGAQVERINYKNEGDTPTRKTGTVTVFDAASFNMVIADNKDAGACSIYIDRNPLSPKVTAVMNGHGKEGAGWGDFRCHLEFRPTPQWQKWRVNDGKMLSQVEFAEFLEQNMEDVAEPPGAELLELCTQLQIIRTVNFRSKVTLSSGAMRFMHDQDDQASVGAGEVQVPTDIMLGIAPIFGLPSYKIPARLRYRLTGGKLTLGYKLQRIEATLGTILEDVIEKIEKGTNISMLAGTPPGLM